MDHSPHITPRTALPWICGAILVILVATALRAAAPVVVPLVFGIFITLLLGPLDRLLTGVLPRGLKWLGRVAVLVLMLGLLALFFGGMIFAAQQVVTQMPQISEDWTSWLSSELAPSDLLETLPEEMREPVRSAVDRAGSRVAESTMGMAQMVAGATGSFITALVIVFFLVLLALGEGPVWRNKIDAMCRANAQAEDFHSVADTLSRKLRFFLVVRTIMGLLQGALYVAWIAIFGIGLLPVWFVLTFLMSFIPNLGSVISAALPVIYALFTQDLQTALLLGVGLLAIEQVVGNWIDPKLQGQQIAVSPVVILVSILVWAWIWGIAGALLAVPMTIAIMVTCAHIHPLRPLSLMLSDRTDFESLDAALAE